MRRNTRTPQGYASMAGAIRYATKPEGTHWRAGGVVELGDGSFARVFWWKDGGHETNARLIGRSSIVLASGIPAVERALGFRD